MFLELIRSVDVGLLTRFAATTSFPVDQDGASGLGNQEEVTELSDTTEDELDPEIPFVVEVFFDETTKDGTKSAAGDGGEDDKGNSILLLVRFPHIGDHTKSHGATSRREADESASDKDGAKIWSYCAGDLPDVCQEQGELQDGPSSDFFTPRCPQFAAKSVTNEHDSLTDSSCLFAHTECFRDTTDSVGVDTSIEVHGTLDNKDDAQDQPFFGVREAEAKFFVAVGIEKFDFPIISVGCVLFNVNTANPASMAVDRL